MKFKGIEKRKTPKKKDVNKPEKMQEESLRKEEIREVVEETIEALSNEPEQETEETKDVNPLPEQETKENTTLNTPASTQGELTQQTPSVASEEPEEKQIPTEKKEPIPTLPTIENGKETTNTTRDSATTPVITPSVPQIESAETFTQSLPQTTSKKPLIILFVIVIILGIVVGAGLWYGTSHNLVSLKSILPIAAKPTPTPEVLPTVTPTPTIDLSQYTITVLNGSTFSGVAAKAEGTLTTAGFTVGKIGNATTNDYTQTVISAKSTVSKEYLTKLEETLQQVYTVSSTVQTADASQSSDVVVTIGSATK